MGGGGYIYSSAKDQCRWHNISPKKYIHIIMEIGYYMALSPDDFEKTKRVNEVQSIDKLSQMLISAFGDGTKQE